MMDINTTVLSLIGGAVILAVIAPLFFDTGGTFQSGTALTFVERAFCVINTPFDSTNATCDSVDDTVTFIGVGIDIASNFANDTITFTSTGGGGNDTTTASNIGGGADVFAQKIFDDLEFRSLTSQGDGIVIIQGVDEIEFSLNANLNDIESPISSYDMNVKLFTNYATPTTGTDVQRVNRIGLQDLDLTLCADGEEHRFNGTTSKFECEPELTGAGGSENTTATNIGTSGTGVFSAEVADELQFKKLIGISPIVVTSNTTNVIINSTSGTSKFFIGSTIDGGVSTNSTVYSAFFHQGTNTACTAMRTASTVSGNATDLYVVKTLGARGASWTLYVNCVATALTCTTPQVADTSCSDTTHSVVIVAGDRLNIGSTKSPAETGNYGDAIMTVEIRPT